MEHTKTPWRVGTAYHNDVTIESGNGTRIAVMENPDMFYEQKTEDHISYSKTQEANTEFIVRACNAHEDLLDACAQAINDWHADDANFHIEEPKYLKMARKAISKAEGR